MPLDTGLWTQWGTGTVSVSSDFLMLTPTGTSGQYVGVYSNATYDLTNKTVQCQWQSLLAPNTGGQSYLRCEIDANNAVIVGMGENPTVVFCQHQLGGTTTTIFSGSVPTSTPVGVRLVFDNAQNFVWFDTYSVVGGWVNRASEAIPLATTALRVVLGAGCYQAVASPGQAWVEQVGYPIQHTFTPNTPAGRATVAVTLSRLRGLSGLSAGVASETTSILNARRSLAASAAGTATAKAGFGLSGRPTGVAAASGTLTALRSLARTISGVATGAATITRRRALVATAASTATAAGSLTATRSLVVSAAGKATTDASFRDPYATVIMATPGLVGYWRVGEPSGTQAADSSGNGRHGTFVGGVTRGQPGAIAVVAPSEASFKGNATDAYMTASVPASNVFTAEGWVRSPQAVWNVHGWFSSARVANGWVIHPMVGTTNIGFYLIGSDGTTYAQIGGDVSAGNIQNWHHIALTFDGTTAVGYIDGVAVVTSAPVLTRTVGGTWPTYWGYDYNLSGRFGDGWIDEAAMYNVALNAATVRSHYLASFRKVDLVGASAGQATTNVILTNPRWKPLAVSATYPPQGAAMTVGLLGSDRTLQRPLLVRQVASGEVFDALELIVPLQPLAPNALLYVIYKYGSVPGHASVGTQTWGTPQLLRFGASVSTASTRYSTGTGTAVPNEAGIRSNYWRLTTGSTTQGTNLAVRVYATGATNVGWIQATVLEIHGFRPNGTEYLGSVDAYYSTSAQAFMPYFNLAANSSFDGLFIGAVVTRATAAGSTFGQVGLPGTFVRIAENTDGTVRLPHATDLLIDWAGIQAAKPPPTTARWNLPTSVNWGALSENIRGPTPTLAGTARGVGWAPDFTWTAANGFENAFLWGNGYGQATCVGQVSSRPRQSALVGPNPETFTTDGVLNAPWAYISSGTPTVQNVAGGTVNLGAAASTASAYAGISAPGPYNVMNKVVMAEFAALPAAGATIMLRVEQTAGAYWMEIGRRADGQLCAQYWTTGISTWANIAWPAGLRAVRIVIDYPNAPSTYSGRILYEYTIDGVRWITLGQQDPTYVWMGLTSCKIALRTDANNVVTPGTASFDNFNVIPFPWVPYKSMTGVAAGQGATPRASFVPFVHDFEGFANGISTTTAQISGARPTDEYGIAIYGHANLTAYWRLGERSGTTAMDASANGRHHGTYMGGVALGQASALSDNADFSADFNGTSGYVEIPDFTVTGDMTVEAWYKADAWATHHIIIERRTPANTGGWILYVSATGVPQFQTYNTALAWTSISSSRGLALGVWHHIVAAYHQASQQTMLMVNGEVVARGTGAGVTNNPVGAFLRIGCDFQGGGKLDGQVDEVALYNAVLPDAVQQSHWQIGVKGRDLYQRTVQETSGLVAHWPLNEATRANAFEYTGKGLTLTHGTGVTVTGPTQGIPGAPYRSLYFDNSTNAKATRSVIDASINFGTAPFSLELWSYQDTLLFGPLIEWGDVTTWGFHAWKYPPGNESNLWVNFGPGMPGAGGINTGAYLTTGVWHHIVVLRTGNIGRAYIDGVQRGGDYDTTGVATGTNYPFNIGYRPMTPPGTGSSGYIDQVALYNRALTPAEIASHYAIGRTPPLYGTSAGKATTVARAPKRLPLMIFNDDFEDNYISPDKWDIWASGMTAEQAARPWAVRP